MKKHAAAVSKLSWLMLLWVMGGFWAPLRAVSGWVAISNPPPAAIGQMLLLSDGTVMAAFNSRSSGTYSFPDGYLWAKLTPDSHGSYVNGSWSLLAPMHDSRLFFAAAVLRDGRVFVAGGEYGTGASTAEIYDPVSQLWSYTASPGNVLFLDASSKMLPDGNVLVGPKCYQPPCDSGFGIATLIYNAVTNGWSPGPSPLRSQNEASWIKLPDDSILTVDAQSTQSERLIPSPSGGLWITDSDLPVALYDPYGSEIGAGLLLPNGKAFILGATGHTAIYSPTGSSDPGSWAQGPDIPGGHGTPDAPAAMMPNGNVLCAVTPAPYGPNLDQIYTKPTTFYEYDYSAGSVGSFTLAATLPGAFNKDSESYNMLVLPDGNVLISGYDSALYVYQPSGPPTALGKPAIISVSLNGDGSYHLIGTQLNGISAGAAFGDDAQMDSNYPLVRLTDGAGNVFYARTYNWSSTGVMTGNTAVSTEFKVPAGLASGVYSLAVIANGISSDSVTFSMPAWVDFNYAGSLQNGGFDNPYKTLVQGANAVSIGGPVMIKAGASSETIQISKPMTLNAFGGLVTIGQ